jgi:hypothetical protein
MYKVIEMKSLNDSWLIHVAFLALSPLAPNHLLFAGSSGGYGMLGTS